MLWLAAVAVLVHHGRVSALRCLAVGLLLGTAFAVSLKSVLMLAALGLAAAGTFGLRRWTEGRWPWRREYPWAILAGWLGMAVVPGILAGFFATHGAWTALVACTVGHNNPASAAKAGSYAVPRPWLFPIVLCGLVPWALGLLRAGGERGWRRAFVLLAAGGYGALLVSFWPSLTRQTFLPLFPLAAVPLVAAGWSLARRPGTRWRWTAGAAWWLPGAVAALEVAGILAWKPPWISHGQGAARQIGAVLRVTDPGQFVMDAEGASVFRPRPYHPVLESLTLKQIKLGRRRDDIAETLVTSRTAVVIREGLTERATTFVDANYLPVGSGVGGGQVAAGVVTRRRHPLRGCLAGALRAGLPRRGDRRGTARWRDLGRSTPQPPGRSAPLPAGSGGRGCVRAFLGSGLRAWLPARGELVGQIRPTRPGNMNGRGQLLRLTAADRVLVLAVHPDDESLATGGLLRRAVSVGASVRVIFITDGENNPWPQRVIERRWRIGPTERARWGRRRRQEALTALGRLGVAATDARFLGWPD